MLAKIFGKENRIIFVRGVLTISAIVALFAVIDACYILFGPIWGVLIRSVFVVLGYNAWQTAEEYGKVRYTFHNRILDESPSLKASLEALENITKLATIPKSIGDLPIPSMKKIHNHSLN